MELKENLNVVCKLLCSRFNCGFIAMSNRAAMFTSSKTVIFVIESPSDDPDEYNVAFSPACEPSCIAEIMKFLCKIPSIKIYIAQDFYFKKDSTLVHGKDVMESYIYDMIDSIGDKQKPKAEQKQQKKFSYSGYPDIDERDYNFEGDEDYYGAEPKEKRHNKKIH